VTVNIQYEMNLSMKRMVMVKLRSVRSRLIADVVIWL